MADTLTDAKISEALSNLDGWERDGDMITRTFETDSYAAGLAVATTVGMIADGHNHHPDMMIGYKKVTVSFTTHDEGNKITSNDIDVATAINSVKLG
ncbi:MAG: 4a-hydroxytetrahydrobiopterin dehydratase [Aggregatilineales bacterium]